MDILSILFILSPLIAFLSFVCWQAGSACLTWRSELKQSDNSTLVNFCRVFCQDSRVGGVLLLVAAAVVLFFTNYVIAAFLMIVALVLLRALRAYRDERI